MSKVLAISYFLPPCLTPQSIQIGRLLSDSRHDIIAVSVNDRNMSYDYDLFPDFDNNLKHHIRIKNRKIFSGLIHKFFIKYFDFYSKYPDCFRWIVNDIVKVACNEIENQKIDKIVTFGQPMTDHIVGLILKKKYPYLEWISHFSDPWIDNPYITYNSKAYKFNLNLENAVIRRSDKIIFTSQESIDLISLRYTNKIKEKCFVLNHSYDSKLYKYDKNHKKDKKILFSYVGELYGIRTPEFLFKAIRLLEKRNRKILNNVEFCFVGNVSKKFLLSDDFLFLNNKFIKVLPQVPYLESLKIMEKSDVLMLIDAYLDNSPFFPSKLVDYIGAKKYILGMTPMGTSRKVLQKLGLSSVNPNDINAIANEIENILIYKWYESVNYIDTKSYDIMYNQKIFDDIIGG